MDGIGEFIYLIILAIIFIVQAVVSSNKKKKKRESQRRGSGTERPDRKSGPADQKPGRGRSFEEMLEDVMGERKEGELTDAPPFPEREEPSSSRQESTAPTPPREVEKKTAQAPPNKYQKYMMDHPDVLKRSEKRTKFAGDSTDQLEVIELGEGSPHSAEEALDVDLRQAIIYQAILERKFDNI